MDAGSTVRDDAGVAGSGRRVASLGVTAGFIASMVIGSIALLVLWLFVPTKLSKSPVTVTSITLPAEANTCPGDEMSFELDFSVGRPTLIDVDVAILDSNDNVVSGTGERMPSRPHPRPAESYRQVTFTVPDLPPGDYQRVMSLTTREYGSEPIFIVIPFTVGEYCGG